MPLAISVASLAPTLEVIIKMQFLKSTLCPWESVRWPKTIKHSHVWKFALPCVGIRALVWAINIERGSKKKSGREKQKGGVHKKMHTAKVRNQERKRREVANQNKKTIERRNTRKTHSYPHNTLSTAPTHPKSFFTFVKDL